MTCQQAGRKQGCLPAPSVDLSLGDGTAVTCTPRFGQEVG